MTHKCSVYRQGHTWRVRCQSCGKHDWRRAWHNAVALALSHYAFHHG